MKKFPYVLTSLTILALILIIYNIPMMFPSDISDNENYEGYTELHFAYYHVSQPCIDKYFLDQQREDGLILLFDQTPIPEDCETDLKGRMILYVPPNISKPEADMLSVKIYKTMIEHKANLLHLERIKYNLRKYKPKQKIKTPYVSAKIKLNLLDNGSIYINN